MCSAVVYDELFARVRRDVRAGATAAEVQAALDEQFADVNTSA